MTFLLLLTLASKALRQGLLVFLQPTTTAHDTIQVYMYHTAWPLIRSIITQGKRSVAARNLLNAVMGFVFVFAVFGTWSFLILLLMLINYYVVIALDKMRFSPMVCRSLLLNCIGFNSLHCIGFNSLHWLGLMIGLHCID